MPRRLSEAAGVVARAVVQYSKGVKTILDWADEGFKAVPIDEAQSRSDICAGKDGADPCPHNREATFPLVGAVAEAIKAQVEKKNRLQLSVVGEEKLHACDICKCSLPLKVWTPMETILSSMSPDTLKSFEQYPPCWMNKQKPSP